MPPPLLFDKTEKARSDQWMEMRGKRVVLRKPVEAVVYSAQLKKRFAEWERKVSLALEM